MWIMIIQISLKMFEKFIHHNYLYLIRGIQFGLLDNFDTSIQYLMMNDMLKNMVLYKNSRLRNIIVIFWKCPVNKWVFSVNSTYLDSYNTITMV